ncbi:similar to Saccharomyces cerevisiae YLR390W ECM19 Putative protein of unknown function [Maudiozyma barnettii]|uniref:Protein ECM19 n=1 Tax=Maudiozyma barnettii TaxID=61262 RepID=A0A8H2ZLI5_9SACH|nr:Ecm19p [Kazachstania barnettii]CAB4256162.1 similar to Saccharomyces cerevisiae YLR390W ECM19 Putative protein of unknown function [Kazachstania barnettii]CAD1784770.1 similar to Saccharomyces cerevisiae YLR390W ECM19 Putative protein of unknown function [Kazachstania barnettii]
MARVRGFGITTVGIVAVASVYMGINFFQPIVVEQLRKDGNLRNDIDLPKFDKDGNVIVDEKDRVLFPGNQFQSQPVTPATEETNH